MQTKSGLYNKERQKQIGDLVKEKGTISVQELAEMFQVSTATIRSDLTVLEEYGELTRTHGGAIPKLTVRHESAISERKNETKKASIGSFAAGLASDNENILIDSGTTALFFAKELVKQQRSNLRIYTNDLAVAGILEANPAFDIHLLGGKVRNDYHYTYGEEVLRALRLCHFDKVFLTTSALDTTYGLTSTAPHLSEIKGQMIQSSEKVILLADSTKFGQVCLQKFGRLSDVDTLVMDDAVTADTKELLSKEIAEINWV